MIVTIPDLRAAMKGEIKPSLTVACCRAQYFVALSDRPVDHHTAMAMLALARRVRAEWQSFMAIHIGGHIHVDPEALTRLFAEQAALQAEILAIREEAARLRSRRFHELLVEGRLNFRPSGPDRSSLS